MDPDAAEASGSGKSPSVGLTAGEATPTDSLSSNQPVPNSVANLLSQAFNGESTIGSPLKKQRADGETLDRSANFPSGIGDVLGRATADQQKKQDQPPTKDNSEVL